MGNPRKRRRGHRRLRAASQPAFQAKRKGKQPRSTKRSAKAAYINKGYFGWLTIQHQATGEQQVIVVPIRERKDNNTTLGDTSREQHCFSDGEYRWKGFKLNNSSWDNSVGLPRNHPGGSDLSKYRVEEMGDNFVALQNKGWKVVRQWGWQYPPAALLDNDFYRAWIRGKILKEEPQPEKEASEVDSKEAKKDTDEVQQASSKTSNQVHGGDNASREVKDSPNSAKEGEQEKKKKSRRGKRGRRKKEHGEKRPGDLVAVAKQTGSKSVRVMAQQATVDQGDVRKAADILKELVGRASQEKMKYSTKLWEEEFLLALETGENPIPYLDRPAKKPKSRVLISPDQSGSCQGWCGVSKTFCKALLEIPDLDVVYIENSNGYFYVDEPRFISLTIEDIKQAHGEFDFVFYLGDGDGHDTMTAMAQSGSKVLMFDSYCARLEAPFLNVGQDGNLYHVGSVSTKSTATWVKGLQLVKDEWH